MSRPLFRIEEDQGQTYGIYHFFACFIVDDHLISRVKQVAGVDVVWQNLEQNHFAVAFDRAIDAEIIMLRLKAALTRYVRENQLDQPPAFPPRS